MPASGLASSFRSDDDSPLFVISVAAQMAGMHAQTLRQYDRLGIVTPTRTRGGGRRYSTRDVQRLREVQRLSQEGGVGLAGIRRILELEALVSDLGKEVEHLRRRLEQAEAGLAGRRVFAAGKGGDVVAVPPGRRPFRRPTGSGAVVLWRPSSPEPPSR